LTSWWSETNQLAALLIAAKASGRSLPDHVRTTTAVLRDWDAGMFNLIIVNLNLPVFAFKGNISPQNEAQNYMNSEDKKELQKEIYQVCVFWRRKWPGSHRWLAIARYQNYSARWCCQHL
jgi:hypothetical protein